MKQSNAKSERLLSDIKKNIIEIITQDIQNPNIGFITITDVKVSTDLSYAKVYVSFLKKEEIHDTLKALNRSKGYIRSELSHRLKTRRVPEISFEVDDGFEREQKIEQLLKK